MLEWACSLQRPAHVGRPSRVLARVRAAWSALRLPNVPPDTKVPPAVVGQPANDAIQASA
ncbi:MAG: hypothetical protein R2706_17835 [Acidimicrobiales bacterium]